MLIQRLNRARTYVRSPGVGPLFVRSIAGSSAVRIAAMLASFGVGVQLARGLGVEGYGYYGLALSIITIASIPAELGLSRLVTREVAAAEARRDYPAFFAVLKWADRTCWRFSAVMAALLGITGAILIARGNSVLGTAVLLGIPTVPFMALSRIKGGALQGLHYITLGQVPANLLRPLFLSLLLLVAWLTHALGPATAIALNSATAILVFGIARFWLIRRTPVKQQHGGTVKGREWLASTIPLALTDGMRMLQLELTAVLLGAMTMPADVGLFRIAVTTATVAAAPLVVIAHTTMPMIARLHADGDQVRLQKVVTYSALVQTAGVLLLSLPLLIAPQFLLSAVFGPGFAAAGTGLQIISAAQIANAAFGPNVALLNMTHQEKRVSRAMLIGVCLNVLTVLLLSRVFGVVGAALGFAASLLTWNVITWLDARRLLQIETSILSRAAFKWTGLS